MRVLVTGIAGFVGSHCAKALHAQGHEVSGLDNLNDYYSPKLKRARLEELEKTARVRFTEADLCDKQALARLFDEQRPERVLHLAAQVGVRYSLENPDAYVSSNVVGTLNVLECCRQAKVPRLVYASSSSVYGGSERLPYSEEDPSDRPVSLYAATKRADELMAHAYTHLYGIQTVGLRFFTVYGPWGRPDMALWLFTEAISSGRPIKVFNHGRMSRDFTYVDDIVAGVMAALFSDGLDPYEVLNLGNHRSEPLTNLIAVIEKALGRRAEKKMMPLQPGDVLATYADTVRSARKLGFQPKTSIEEGVPRFVEWYRAHPEFHSS
ncbi:MAG TPA: NAD-dependent epimerase/dehydratase family protein [Vicinamibacteria bacterium]|nr:NAD-dependent epimerase/dehydratase family protein [Vicinamibacteria bacterium]